ncbi:hypothetical protein BDV96DRAFT_603516 [Lophiotrema nucula]|uniref:RING-type domain-containing protein n=1 Tax=Lophiotrema nucula TaxID=690887 RepID=A0A6A5YXS3_9PLEO|nr:hypothetical protein BDV96DRAFT_603516 [Lophiotrema nucula]
MPLPPSDHAPTRSSSPIWNPRELLQIHDSLYCIGRTGANMPCTTLLRSGQRTHARLMVEELSGREPDTGYWVVRSWLCSLGRYSLCPAHCSQRDEIFDDWCRKMRAAYPDRVVTMEERMRIRVVQNYDYYGPFLVTSVTSPSPRSCRRLTPALDTPCPDPHVRRRTLDDECPICFEDGALSENNIEELVWCKKECGRSVHKSCFESWKKTCRRNRKPLTCAMCRAVWQRPCECDEMPPAKELGKQDQQEGGEWNEADELDGVLSRIPPGCVVQ